MPAGGEARDLHWTDSPRDQGTLGMLEMRRAVGTGIYYNVCLTRTRGTLHCCSVREKNNSFFRLKGGGRVRVSWEGGG